MSMHTLPPAQAKRVAIPRYLWDILKGLWEQAALEAVKQQQQQQQQQQQSQQQQQQQQQSHAAAEVMDLTNGAEARTGDTPMSRAAAAALRRAREAGLAGSDAQPCKAGGAKADEAEGAGGGGGAVAGLAGQAAEGAEAVANGDGMPHAPPVFVIASCPELPSMTSVVGFVRVQSVRWKREGLTGCCGLQRLSAWTLQPVL